MTTATTSYPDLFHGLDIALDKLWEPQGNWGRGAEERRIPNKQKPEPRQQEFSKREAQQRKKRLDEMIAHYAAEVAEDEERRKGRAVIAKVQLKQAREERALERQDEIERRKQERSVTIVARQEAAIARQTERAAASEVAIIRKLRRVEKRELREAQWETKQKQLAYSSEKKTVIVAPPKDIALEMRDFVRGVVDKYVERTRGAV